MMWQFLGIAGLVGMLMGGIVTNYVNDIKYERLEKRFSEFKSNTEKLEIAATARKKEIEKSQQENKKRVDEENKRLRADVSVANKRLRDTLASRSFVPNSPGTPGNPEVACFDRAKLDEAIRRLAQGVSGLTGKGDEAITDLNSAKRWAQRY